MLREGERRRDIAYNRCAAYRAQLDPQMVGLQSIALANRLGQLFPYAHCGIDPALGFRLVRVAPQVLVVDRTCPLVKPIGEDVLVAERLV